MTEEKKKMDIDNLYEKAQAATPGPWRSTAVDQWELDDEEVDQAGVDTPSGSLTWDDHGGEVFKPEDARFIAVANPKAIMELIDTLRESRENEVQCTGMCLTGADVGVYGNEIAYPHNSCPKHGDPVAYGIRGDMLLDEFRERIAELEAEVVNLQGQQEEE